MKKILITGSTGFVGRAVTAEMIAAGYEVHSCSRTGRGAVPGLQVHRADLLDKADVGALFRTVQPECLIHTAWCSGHGTYWTDPENLDWVGANAVIARQFVDQGGQYALFTGTSAEYDWSGNDPLREEDLARPNSVYGGAKLGSYISLEHFFGHNRVGFGWTRLFNPFGQFEDERRLIPKMCNKLLGGERVEFDAGMEKRDFLHVADIATAYRRILEERVTGVVNVASGVSVVVRDVVSLIAEAAGSPDSVSFSTPGTDTRVSVIVADISKLKAITGWEPSQSLDSRIYQTVDWWRNKIQSK